MNSIYDLRDGMHGPSARLYLLNKYYKYVSGTVLNPDTPPPDSRNSDKCDNAVREAVLCKQVGGDGMWPSEKSLMYHTFILLWYLYHEPVGDETEVTAICILFSQQDF